MTIVYLLLGSILIYFVLLHAIYLMLVLLGSVQIRKYNRGITFAEFDRIAKSDLSMPVTIIVPAHNESAIIVNTAENLLKLNYPAHEVIVVDDGSTDTHASNRGKGAAVRTGLREASGTHVLVFDADHEYDPSDIVKLLEPVRRGRAEVVYGVRIPGIHTLQPSLMHALGNKVMTAAVNLVYGAAINDLHTCLKLLPLPLVRAMTLTETGFGLDTEITGEMLRRGFRPYELPVSYVGRSKEEGKKIKFRDAFACFAVMVKVRLRGRVRPGHRDRSLVPRTV